MLVDGRRRAFERRVPWYQSGCVTAVGLVLLAGIMDITWLGNAGRKQELLEVAVLNYLNNRLPAEAWERSRQTEKEALIHELREKRADGRISEEEETEPGPLSFGISHNFFFVCEIYMS